MTPDTRADYTRNIGPALQNLGYSLRNLDLDALAADLHALPSDPQTTTPAQVIREIGGINDVLPEYAHSTAHPVHIPAHDNLDPHTPATVGGDDLADRQEFTFREWLQAVQGLRAAATDLGVDPAQFNAAQALTDLLQGAGRDIAINEHTVRHLKGDYGLAAFADHLTGDAAPGIGYQGQDGDAAAINFNGTGF